MKIVAVDTRIVLSPLCLSQPLKACTTEMASADSVLGPMPDGIQAARLGCRAYASNIEQRTRTLAPHSKEEVVTAVVPASGAGSHMCQARGGINGGYAKSMVPYRQAYTVLRRPHAARAQTETRESSFETRGKMRWL